MKKIAVSVIMLVLVLVISACGNDERQGVTSGTEVLTLSQMQHDPMSFTGVIYVEGIVVESHDSRFDFYLVDKDSDFALAVEYRGSLALPETGKAVQVEGRMGYRPCCGPFLTSMSFVEAGFEVGGAE